MSKTVKDLIKGFSEIEVIGNESQVITSLTLDSRKVLPGSLFIAISGQKDDGFHYIEEAINRGAVAIMACRPYNGVHNITVLQVKDVRCAMAYVARQFYDFPDQTLHLVGVTGTNGKTTVTTVTQFLLKEENYEVGLLGSVYYDLGKKTLPATKTTPESIDIEAMLNQMLQADCKAAVMEVSSHGIAMKRVQSMSFDIAVFLNLTREHLDFHQDMESYFCEKKKFFIGETGNIPRIAIINIDDEYGVRLSKEIPEGVKLITFGISKDAMIQAKDLHFTATGLSFKLLWQGEQEHVESGLLGAYNVSNILASLAIGWASGRNMRELIKKLPNFKGVRGRMEKVDIGQKFSVLVDYAHTGDALYNALKTLRPITSGRLLVVFGCGGDRDRGRRSSMTAAVQKWADFAWATADNPRGESLESIFSDMRAAVTKSDKILFVPERRRAIDRAIEDAQTGDCVLIAGKGHETYQLVGTSVFPFDDCQVVKELLVYKNKIN